MNEWQPIETCPHNVTVILANFTAKCLITGAPHVWTATYVTEWENLRTGEPEDEKPMWTECSFAAMNENGEPTHWMPLPKSPND